MRAGLLIPAGFIAGALASHWILRAAPAAVAVDLHQPVVVVTYWGTFGAAMSWALLCALAIAALGYVVLLRRIVKMSPRRALLWTIILSAAACGAVLLFPAVFSSDVYAYAAYGDLALHNISPYAHARVVLRDPLLDAAVWQWGNPLPVAVYGAAFLAVAKGVVFCFAPLGAAATLNAFRALSCVALVACAPLAWYAFAPWRSPTRELAAAGIALNPVSVWSAGEGHNDPLLVFVALLGFTLIVRGRRFWGAFTIAFAALIKSVALTASALTLAAMWRDRAVFRQIAAGTTAGLALVIALSGSLVWGVGTRLVPAAHYAPQFSPQAALAVFLPLPWAIAITAAAAAACVLYGTRKLLRGDTSGCASAALGAWLAVPNPYPWYALWIVPAAFLAWETPAAAGVLAASLLIAARYYAEATGLVSPEGTLAIVACAFVLPWIVIGLNKRFAHRVRPEIQTPAPDFAPLRSR